MSRANRFGLYPMICCALLCGCAATTPTDLLKPEDLAPQVLNKVEAAELTVINASGWTLTPSNDNILDNGKLLVSLRRQTYQKILINPGPHEFRFDHSPNGRRVAKLNAERGGDYYLLTAYDPSRGGLLLAIQGDPMVIRMIDAQDAQAMISKIVPK